MGDRYDDMTGPALGEELSKRQLAVSGRVEELRDRLREDDNRKAEEEAQRAADGSDPTPEGEDTDADDVEVPEQREPWDMEILRLELTEDQARELTRREAGISRQFKHVAPFEPRKYLPGDRVAGVTVDRKTAVVLGTNVTLQLDNDQQTED